MTKLERLEKEFDEAYATAIATARAASIASTTLTATDATAAAHAAYVKWIEELKRGLKMKNDYVNIGMSEYGDKVLCHNGKALNEDNMLECEFMHNFGSLTTVRVVSTGRQLVKLHKDFYVKQK